jgi:preprotein translocase subunit SecG
MDRVLFTVAAVLAVVVLVGVLIHDIQKTAAAASLSHAAVHHASSEPALDRPAAGVN